MRKELRQYKAIIDDLKDESQNPWAEDEVLLEVAARRLMENGTYALAMIIYEDLKRLPDNKRN